MILKNQEEIFPEIHSRTACTLSIFEFDDEEEYIPYESPFNTAQITQVLNIENPDEELKKFNLQMGKNITWTYHLAKTFDVNLSRHYTSLETTATVNLPYLPYDKDKRKYIQKGNRCLLRIFRLGKNEDAYDLLIKDHKKYLKAINKRATKQDEYDKELEYFKQEMEDSQEQNIPASTHTPLPGQNSNNPITQDDLNTLHDVTLFRNQPEQIDPKDQQPVTDFVHKFAPLEVSEEEDRMRSLEGFITDVKLKPDNIEVTIKGWSILFEGQNILEFHQMHRSEIVKEVIASAGLVPLVDFTGMPDEVIDWKSSKDEGNAPLKSAIGDDCTSTGQMSVDTSLRKDGKTGDGTNYDAQSGAGYAKQGTDYYNWARQYKDVQSLARAFRAIWKYRRYPSNEDNCADDTFHKREGGKIRANCWDTARLFKCCCDAAGFPCVVLGGPGHAWNAIKVGNQWRTWDACYSSNLGKAGSTNGAGF